MAIQNGVSGTGSASLDEIRKTQSEFYGADKAKKKELDKDSFLKLLVTQMKHQDPLNPMDDKQFIAQLAQFSSLEQMTNVSKGIEALIQKTGQQDMLGAVNYIGKDVTASGDSITKTEGSISPLFFKLEKPAESITVNVMDSNNQLVRTEKMSATKDGEYYFLWDGEDYNGMKAPNGQYKVGIAAKGSNGEAVLTTTTVAGRVTALEQADGKTFLRLHDGRKIDFTQIQKVVQPEANTTQKDDSKTAQQDVKE